MAVVHSLGFSNYQNFQIFGHKSGGMTSVHCHTNFVRIGPMVAEISHLTIVKMVALRHVGFLKILFF